MDRIFHFLAANPWFPAAMAVGVLVWLTALVVVIRSPKFLRKWLWALLTFFSFTFNWTPEPGLMVGVGIPLGALYVLGFWRFGPEPTAEQRARHAARRAKLAEAGKLRDGRLAFIKGAYLLAAMAALAMSLICASGVLLRMMLEFAGGAGVVGPPLTPGRLQTFAYAQAGLAFGIGALFVFLAWRPYWWGKLILLWAGLSWAGFGLVGGLLFGARPALGWTLAIGLALLAAAVAHQLADPRLGGGYARRL